MNAMDILMPVVEKDLEVLPHAINLAKKNINHPVGDVFIIAPEISKIIECIHKENCRFVNENSVLQITRKDIDYCPKIKNTHIDRSGWLFQQLLKLSGDIICSHENFLVLDADTLLIRPHVFEHNDKTVFFYKRKIHKPYLDTYQRLLGEDAMAANHFISFVTHYMYFNKKRIKELKKLIEDKHSTNWYIAVINCINKDELSSFAEYETYGNFIYRNYSDQMILKECKNLSLKRGVFKGVSGLNINELAKKYNSISFHAWNQ